MAAKPKPDELQVQLATRIPKALHRALKIHVIHSGVSMMRFIVEAIETALKHAPKRSARSKPPPKKRARPKRSPAPKPVATTES